MTTYHEVGDTLVGDRIVGEARKISKPKVIIKSGRHKAQQVVLGQLPLPYGRGLNKSLVD